MPRIRRAVVAPSRQAFYSGNRISMPRSALARELSQAKEQVAKDPDRIAHQRAVVSVLAAMPFDPEPCVP
jgi:hypothetical protein